MRPFVTVMEHPDFGEARVFCRWVPLGDGYVTEPYAVQWDLFTSDSEVVELTELLRGSMVDRSISVSAFPSHSGEDYV